MFRMARVVRGFGPTLTEKVHTCDTCAQSKITRAPVPKQGRAHAFGILDVAHTDFKGPLEEESRGGVNYFVTFTDDRSRYTWVYPIQHKSDVFTTFKEWLPVVEKQTGRQLKVLRSDNGGEYVSSEMEQIMKSRGIV